MNEEGRPCLSVGAPLHRSSAVSPASDAESESTLPMAHIAILYRIGARSRAAGLLAPFMQVVREGDAETFAPEFADGGYTVCHICRCRVSNAARLDCSGCAA